MNAKQASVLLEQAIDVAQCGGTTATPVEYLELVAGLLCSFRDGWFRPHRLRAERAPTVPAPPEMSSLDRLIGRMHRQGSLPLLKDVLTKVDAEKTA